MVLLIVFFLNLYDCVQGGFMSNFRVLASILTDIFNFLPEGGTQSELVSEIADM